MATVKRWIYKPWVDHGLGNHPNALRDDNWHEAKPDKEYVSAEDYARLEAERDALQKTHDAAKDIIERDRLFQEWAQGYLDSCKWAGHDRADAVRQELVTTVAERADVSGALLDSGVAVGEDLSAAVRALTQERDALKAFLERDGYRRCDIPACNCTSYHGGHAMRRLEEIQDACQGSSVPWQGTILKTVQAIESERDALARWVAELEQFIRRAAVWDPDDVQGLRYHAFELLRACADPPAGAEGSEPK